MSESESNDGVNKDLKAAIEALLFATQGMTTKTIAERLGIDKRTAERLLQELELENLQNKRGFEVVKDGELWKMSIRSEFTQHVKDLIPPELPKSLTKTLAVISAHAPVTQSFVVKVRGNKAYNHIKHLNKMGFIVTMQKGNTLLIDLTEKFFDYFHIDKEKLQQKLKEKSFYL